MTHKSGLKMNKKRIFGYLNFKNEKQKMVIKNLYLRRRDQKWDEMVYSNVS